jgi:hypothetical protein
MKKSIFLILIINLLFAKEFKGSGEFVSESKRDACNVALNYAKEEAMQHAGTLMLSSFESTTTAASNYSKSQRERKIKQFSMGVTKLKSKDEKVTINQDSFVFTCRVNAVFEIDDKSINRFHQQLLQDERKSQKAEQNIDKNTSDKEIEKLRLQRDIELLKLKQKEQSKQKSSQNYKPASRDITRTIKRKTSKNSLGLVLEIGANLGDMNGYRAEAGVGFNNFVVKLGSGRNTLSISNDNDYNWDSSTDLFSYDYSSITVEFFINKKREGLSFGISSQAIDKESFENNEISYDTQYQNYLIGGSLSSSEYYKLKFSDISAWESGNSMEVFMAITLEFFKFYLSTTPSYQYEVYRYKKNYSDGIYYKDSSYFETGNLGGFNIGAVFRIPIKF